MPKLIVSLEQGASEQVLLLKERTTIGRRPYNDLVINHLTVSGEHAVLIMTANGVVIEDLGSTNGTYVDGVCVRRHTLRNGQVIDVGTCRILFADDDTNADLPVTQAVASPVASVAPASPRETVALLQVISGPAEGRELRLHKVVNTFGRPGEAVAAITNRQNGYVLTHVEGVIRPRLNGVMVMEQGLPLKDGDIIELGQTKVRFVYSRV